MRADNVWLDKAIHQLYMMREEHKQLMQDFKVLKNRVDVSETKLNYVLNHLRKLEESTKDHVIVL